jgi:acyl-CoA synthetase (AMP-forming)/AMP-acid ligase II
MKLADVPLTVSAFLRGLARHHGERDLIVADDRRLTYAEAETRSSRMARSLLAAGVGKGSRVGVLLPNGPEWVLTWLAATRIGAILVPINTFFQAQELSWILRHADIDCLLAASNFLTHDYPARLEAALPGLSEASDPMLRLHSAPLLRRVYVYGATDRAWAGDAGRLDTHGSVLRHATALARLRHLEPADRVWSPMPFFWVGGFVFAFVSNLCAGAGLTSGRPWPSTRAATHAISRACAVATSPTSCRPRSAPRIRSSEPTPSA